MHVLIVGDSFAADWSAKHCDLFGWPNLLAKHHIVTNLAQAGVSEYKIYKQLISVDLSQFDLVIVAHTSPYRVVTRCHPVHSNNSLHKHADLLFGDIEYHYKKTFRGFFNKSVRCAYNFFSLHFDHEYQELSYQLIVDRIEKLLCDIPSITLVTPVALESCITAKNVITIVNNQIESGSSNHLSSAANKQLVNVLLQKINEINRA
jgi:hypothetical protein